MTPFHSPIHMCTHACTALDRGAGEGATAGTQCLTNTTLTTLHQDVEVGVGCIQEDTGVHF